jgi:hypothetical protein
VDAKAKDTVNERTTSILDDLKARAAANPLAAVSIGAGLIWYLVRHPPIATILVGLGVYGLIRTNPNEPDVVSPVWSRAQELAASAANTVNELAEETREAINHASDIAGSISNRAADVAGAFANRGAEVAEAVADSRTGIAHSAKDKLETWTEPRRESGAEAVFRLKTRTDDLTRTAQTAISVASNNRDTVLLGAARRSPRCSNWNGLRSADSRYASKNARVAQLVNNSVALQPVPVPRLKTGPRSGLF